MSKQEEVDVNGIAKEGFWGYGVFWVPEELVGYYMDQDGNWRIYNGN